MKKEECDDVIKPLERSSGLMELEPHQAARAAFPPGCKVLALHGSVIFGIVQSVSIDMDRSNRFVYQVVPEGQPDHHVLCEGNRLQYGPSCAVWIQPLHLSEQRKRVAAVIVGSYQVRNKICYSAQDASDPSILYHGVPESNIMFYGQDNVESLTKVKREGERKSRMEGDLSDPNIPLVVSTPSFASPASTMEGSRGYDDKRPLGKYEGSATKKLKLFHGSPASCPPDEAAPMALHETKSTSEVERGGNNLEHDQVQGSLPFDKAGCSKEATEDASLETSSSTVEHQSEASSETANTSPPQPAKSDALTDTSFKDREKEKVVTERAREESSISPSSAKSDDRSMQPESDQRTTKNHRETHSSSGDGVGGQKLCIPFFVDEERIRDYLIGDNGTNVKRIVWKTNCRIAVKGYGFDRNADKTDPVYVHIRPFAGKANNSNLEEAANLVEDSIVHPYPREEHGRIRYHLTKANRTPSTFDGEAAYQRLQSGSPKREWVSVHYVFQENSDVIGMFMGTRYQGLHDIMASSRCQVTFERHSSHPHLLVLGSSARDVNLALRLIRKRFEGITRHLGDPERFDY